MSAAEESKSEWDYDLIVVGGGSGGLAAAKEAAKLGAKVAMFDYVKPSPQGTTWGLGGTCVNVGCIPKKVMHYSALLAAGFHDAKELGWKVEREFDWDKLVDSVGNYIGSLNWNYRVGVRDAGVEYINAYAEFVDAHTVQYMPKKKKKKKKKNKAPPADDGPKTVTAKYFIVAPGGRPRYPDCEGAREFGITSDDIFYWHKKPGKTLVVGASYIALECAGFLHEMGFDTTVMVRSILLRGFDRQVAEHIGDYMVATGMKFVRPAVPVKLEKALGDDGQPTERIKVTFKRTDTGELVEDVYDTVLFAIGRDPCVTGYGLEKTGVKLAERSRKIIVDDEERTNVEHIYAMGDVAEGKPELTPVAIKTGLLLARRLFKSGFKKKMDYNLVPTTVFTPIEYGCIGYSQEEAEEKFGKDNIEVYLSLFGTAELAASHRVDKDEQDLSQPCMCKIVCDKTRNEQVIGFHYVGPQAGEVTQGFAVAMRCGATKEDFDDTVGIHPTAAEEFTTLTVTARSGKDFKKSGGC